MESKKWHTIGRADGWEVLSLVLGSVLVIFLTVVTKCLTQSSVKQEGLVLAHSLSVQPFLAGKARGRSPSPGNFRVGLPTSVS